MSDVTTCCEHVFSSKLSASCVVFRNAKKSEEKLSTLENELQTNSENLTKLEAEFKQVEIDATNILKNYEELQVCAQDDLLPTF